MRLGDGVGVTTRGEAAAGFAASPAALAASAAARALAMSATGMPKMVFVALACRAVGIDRCVFPTIFNLSRQARHIRPVLTAGDVSEVKTVFSSFSKAGALAELRTP